MCKEDGEDEIYLLVVNVVLHYGKINEFYVNERRNFGHIRNKHKMLGTNEQTNKYET